MVASFIPTCGWISSSLVGLISLRQGPSAGSIVLLFSLLSSCVFLVLGYIEPFLFECLSGVVFVYVMSFILREKSWSFLLCSLGILGTVFVIMIYIFFPGIELWWQLRLVSLMQHQNVFARTITQESPILSKGYIVEISRFLTGIVISFAFFIGISNLLMARAWQAYLFNPKGLSKELKYIRIPKIFTSVSILFLLGIFLFFPNKPSFYPVLLFPFLLSGLSFIYFFIHKIVFNSIYRRVVLCVFYLSLIFVFHYITFLLISILAMLDSFLNLRAIKDMPYISSN